VSILLVDDEDLVRAGTAEMLRQLGHRVYEASGATQALGMLRSGLQVDAVITDYVMPRVNGAELAEAVRQRFPQLPVMVITGYAGGSLPGDLPQLGKPFRQSDLAAALERLLNAAPSNVVSLSQPSR
jgi:CheY-like chemotaxis protein